jgi:ABC-type hemin transport system ATPase subunit
MRIEKSHHAFKMLVRLVWLIREIYRRGLRGDIFVMVSHDLNLATVNAERPLPRNRGIIAGIERRGKMVNLQTLEETYGVIGLCPS